MNTAITLILILSPCVLSLPQFQEDAYRRQLEEQETPQLDENPPQFQREPSSQFQRRVPVARERLVRPFARVQKVPVPQPLPTAAPQPERYTRPEPQLITRQEEVYSRPQPQQPQLISRQDEAYSRPQAQVPLFTQPQFQQTAAPVAPQAQEEEYNSRPLLRVQSIQAAAAAAAPSQEDRYKNVDSRYSTPIPIIKYDKSQSLDGSYKTSYETGNNIVAEESGFIKNIGVKDQEALVQQGTYSYTAPDGTVITTSYTADEGGFRVEGSHIPTPPPIPEEIRKALETIYEGIRQQQEAEAKDAKYGKTRPGSAEETNSISDNYPQNYPTFA
ncbi:uncharacterized protein LOC135835149 [Planococcus citri]|uniref:uncharacterized protein LOC135835149 n=1 Tax=Planococcus citri TaxID=170843 RepID=UPI0031FA22B0